MKTTTKSVKTTTKIRFETIPSERNPDVSAPEIPEFPGIDRNRFGPSKNQAAWHEEQDQGNEERPDRIQMGSRVERDAP